MTQSVPDPDDLSYLRKDLRPGIRQPDRKTLMNQAKDGAAVLWCAWCDHFWREWYNSSTRRWPHVHPGGGGCPQCGETYVIWENYPEWAKLHK